MLSGIRVLDTSTVGPGSRCSAWLADLGADVVKVGRPPDAGGIEPAWHAYGAERGARRIRIDLRDDRGRLAFLALVAGSDVVLDSFRPGVAARLGIGYGACCEVNPGIVYAALTGYGQDGPYAQRAGHDLNYLAVGGFLWAQGRGPDGAPVVPGATVADSAGGGMHAAMSVLAALLRRTASGVGAFLDVAATNGVLSLMSLHVDEYLATGREPAPRGALLLGRYACYDTYTCADGGWVAVGAIEARFFANLVKLLGLPPEMAARQYADEHQEGLRAALAERFASRPRDEWVAELADRDTCVTPVLAISELADDPHLTARGAFARVRDPAGRETAQLAPLLAGAAPPAGPVVARPPGETDTRELLDEAGVDDVDGLLDAGVVS